MQSARIPSLGIVVSLVAVGAWCGWLSGSASASPAPGAVAFAAKSQNAGREPRDTRLDAIGRPIRWQPARGRECIRRGRYKGVCQGPRRVPLPDGPEAHSAQALGLGNVRSVGRLMGYPPRSGWIRAAGLNQRESLLWPVAGGRLSRGLLAAREGRRQHRGLDIAAPEGSPIRAIKSGIVAYSDNAVPGYGNLLVSVHPDGSVAFYGHCRAIFVFAGQRIAQGQIVGEVGQTGRATGPHVHFEYRVRGRLRNPLPLFGDQVPGRRARRPNV